MARAKELSKREAELRDQETQLTSSRAQLQLEQQKAQAAEERAHAAVIAAREQADRAAADCAWARQQQAELTGKTASLGQVPHPPHPTPFCVWTACKGLMCKQCGKFHPFLNYSSCVFGRVDSDIKGYCVQASLRMLPSRRVRLAKRRGKRAWRLKT